jgi:hypothetical protein
MIFPKSGSRFSGSCTFFCPVLKGRFVDVAEPLAGCDGVARPGVTRGAAASPACPGEAPGEDQVPTAPDDQTLGDSIARVKH